MPRVGPGYMLLYCHKLLLFFLVFAFFFKKGCLFNLSFLLSLSLVMTGSYLYDTLPNINCDAK